MNINWISFLTILGMMGVTYSTRLMGFYLLKNKKLSPKMARAMEAAPACVLLSVIAPHFVSDKPHELIALVLVIFSAWRFSMLPTVLIGVISSAVLGYLFNLFN